MSLFRSYKISTDMIKMISPTSKASLKTSCLLMANGDIDKAERLYDYFAKDMPEIPPYDAPTPTLMDNVKESVNSIFSLLGQHKEGLSQGYDVIRAFFNAKGANLPSLAEEAEETAEAVETDLPPIT